MPPIFPVLIAIVTAALVFAAGWRMLPAQNSAQGGVAALLLFLLYPAVLSAIETSSPWDALFVMLFVSAWAWMEHWSLFMRSWVLAGIFAFGLWVGSPFLLWGLVAMAPWAIFNRRTGPALVSMLTVFLGGLLIYAVTWGAAWLLDPAIGRPVFTQWIRWGGLKLPPAVSLPWFLLAAGAVIERFIEMVRERRSDASMFAAILLIVTGLFGSADSDLALVALSAPLIARVLVKKEFLFHRRVRWVASLTFVLGIGLAYALRREAWIATGLAMLAIGIGSRCVQRRGRLPLLMSGEAVCVGAYLAESLGALLHLFPS